ncbi:PIN domain-containing protein, partial [Candidatus Pacearchaeota archaeon]|nr:PIN domain-containing protein [Candidatus Pacearchaeota archaeon]
EKVSYMKSRINIISTDHKIAEKAAEISVKNDLSMTDALIYAAALLNGAILLTLDNDLRGLPNAKVL